jgi:hypothetical protein
VNKNVTLEGYGDDGKRTVIEGKVIITKGAEEAVLKSLTLRSP